MHSYRPVKLPWLGQRIISSKLEPCGFMWLLEKNLPASATSILAISKPELLAVPFSVKGSAGRAWAFLGNVLATGLAGGTADSSCFFMPGIDPQISIQASLSPFGSGAWKKGTLGRPSKTCQRPSVHAWAWGLNTCDRMELTHAATYWTSSTRHNLLWTHLHRTMQGRFSFPQPTHKPLRLPQNQPFVITVLGWPFCEDGGSFWASNPLAVILDTCSPLSLLSRFWKLCYVYMTYSDVK